MNKPRGSRASAVKGVSSPYQATLSNLSLSSYRYAPVPVEGASSSGLGSVSQSRGSSARDSIQPVWKGNRSSVLSLLSPGKFKRSTSVTAWPLPISKCAWCRPINSSAAVPTALPSLLALCALNHTGKETLLREASIVHPEVTRTKWRLR